MTTAIEVMRELAARESAVMVKDKLRGGPDDVGGISDYSDDLSLSGAEIAFCRRHGPLTDYEIDCVIAGIGEEMGVPVEEMVGRNRERVPTFARHMAMWKLCKLGVSVTRIGRIFNRDHSAVINARQKIGGMMKADAS